MRRLTLLCAALRRGIAAILVKKDLAEVCPLSRGIMSAHRLNPLSAPLQTGIRFLRLPLPAAPSAFLTVGLPLGRSYGLTTFRLNDTPRFRSRLSAGGAYVHVVRLCSEPSLTAYLLVRASQHLWLVNNYGSCGDSLSLTVRGSLAPEPR